MSRILSQIFFDIQSIYTQIHSRYIDVIVVILGYVGLLYFHNHVPFWYLLVYILVLAGLGKQSGKKIFPVKGMAIHLLLGSVIVWNVLIGLSSIVTVFGVVTWYTQAIIGVLTPAIVFWFGKSVSSPGAIAIKKERVFFKKNIWLAGFVPLIILLSYILIVPSGAEVVSLWQVTPQLVQFMVFAGLCISGILIYSQYSSSVVLLTIMGMSLCMHIALPLSHVYPWGGDVWRMIGQEHLLVQGQAIAPVLFGDAVSTRDVFGLAIPDVFLVPHKYTYSQIWSSVVFIANHSGFSLEQIHKWLLPVLWSLSVPLMMFLLGMRIFSSRRYALLFSWLSLVPFTFQVLGAISLPNGLGFIYFLFVLYLLIVAIQEDTPFHPMLVFFIVSSVFGYALYTIMLFFLYGVFLFSRAVHKHRFAAPLFSGVFTFAMLLIPFVDVLTGYSQFSFEGLNISSISHGIASFFGILHPVKLFSGDIPYGNIFYNQLPAGYITPSIFSSFRFHIPILICLLFVLSVYGAIVLIQKKHVKIHVKVVSLALFFLSFFGYVIGWGLLRGDVLFTRRLDPVVAYSLLLFAAYGGAKVRTFLSAISFKDRRILYLVFVALISWFSTTVYAVGPDIRSTSNAEYQVGTYFSMQDDISHSCVIASTETLLVLEGKTGSAVVGGNFPIDYQFGQPERLALYEASVNDPELFLTLVSSFFEEKTFKGCYLAIPIAKETDLNITELIDIYGEPTEKIQDVLVWKFLGVDFFSN